MKWIYLFTFFWSITHLQGLTQDGSILLKENIKTKEEELLQKLESDWSAIEERENLGNYGIFVESDLDGIEVTEKEKKKELEKKEVNQSESNEKSDVVAPIGSLKQTGKIFLRGHGQVSLRGGNDFSLVTFGDKTYLFLRVENKNLLYQLVEKNQWKVIDHNLPFDLRQSTVFKNADSLSVLTQKEMKEFEVWTKGLDEEVWVRRESSFIALGGEEPIEESENQEGSKNENINTIVKEEGGSSQKINIKISKGIYYKGNYFLYTDQQELWVSGDLTMWSLLISETPWAGDGQYSPFIHKDRMYVMGVMNSDILEKWYTENGYIWVYDTQDENRTKIQYQENFLGFTYNNSIGLLSGKEEGYGYRGRKNYVGVGTSDEEYLEIAEKLEEERTEELKKEGIIKEGETETKKTGSLDDINIEEITFSDAQKKLEEIQKDSKDKNTSIDLQDNIIDEDVILGTSRDIGDEEKEYIRIDNNPIKKKKIREIEGLEGGGIYFLNERDHWELFSSDFSNYSHMEMVFNGDQFILVGARGIYSGRDELLVAYSDNLRDWDQYVIENSIEEEEMVYYSTGSEYYQFRQSLAQVEYRLIDMSNFQFGPWGSTGISSFSYIIESLGKDILFISDNKLLKWNPEELDIREIPLSFHPENIVGSASSNTETLIYVSNEGSIELYIFMEDEVIRRGTLLMEGENIPIVDFKVVWYEKEYYMTGGKSKQGHNINLTWKSLDGLVWEEARKVVQEVIIHEKTVDEFESEKKKLVDLVEKLLNPIKGILSPEIQTQLELSKDKYMEILEVEKSKLPSQLKSKIEEYWELINKNELKKEEEELYVEEEVIEKDVTENYSARYAHRVFILENKIYMIGGYLREGVEVNDVWVMEEEGLWKKKGDIQEALEIRHLIGYSNKIYTLNWFDLASYGNYELAIDYVDVD